MGSGDVGGSDPQNPDEFGEANTLLSRLRLIEDQPLESRATAFAQIHDELQARLERGDDASPRE